MVRAPPPKAVMMPKPSYSVPQHITHCCSTNNSCGSPHHHSVTPTMMLLWWLLYIHSLWFTTLHICRVLSWVVLLLWIVTRGRGRMVGSRGLLWVHSWWLLWIGLWWIAWLLCSVRERVRRRSVSCCWWPRWIWWWLSICRLWMRWALRVWWWWPSY